MGDISKNFNKSEFKCHHCDFCDPDPRLIDALQRLRDLAGGSIIIQSGCRCKEHNKAVGGAVDSQHLYGKAADIRSKTLNPRGLYKLALKVPAFKNGGIGIYAGWLHVDVRRCMARWGDIYGKGE